MKEFELMAIEQLIWIYKDLLNKGLTREVIKRAKSLYDELSPAHILLSDIISSTVEGLFSVAYPHVHPNRKIPTKEEINKILIALKKRKQELENEFS